MKETPILGTLETQGCLKDRTPTDSSLVLIFEVTLWAPLRAGQLHHCKVECGIMDIKTCLHAFFCQHCLLASPVFGMKLSTVGPYILWDRGRSVTQVVQSEYLFSWVQQLVHRLAEDPSRMNQSPVSVIDMGTREERGPFLQLLSIRAIKAWNFPWLSLPSNAGTCWEWHCAEVKQSQERNQRWRESWWWNCWNAGSSYFWNHCGFPRIWAMLRKSLVECLYILIYWFNLPGDGFLLLKTQSSVRYLWVFYRYVCSQYGLFQGAEKFCLRRSWGYLPLTTQRSKCRRVDALILEAGLSLL